MPPRRSTSDSVSRAPKVSANSWYALATWIGAAVNGRRPDHAARVAQVRAAAVSTAAAA